MPVSVESAKISFFRIRRAGYYKRGEDIPAFSNVADVFDQLFKWSENLDLAETKLYEAGEGANVQPVYFLGMAGDPNSLVFGTWNEVPSHEAGVASISRDSKVGAPDVHLNPVEPNSIPGYATYFWVLPAKNLLATIRFGSRNISGQFPMVHYMNTFLEERTNYVILGKPGSDTNVIGYTNAGDGKPVPGVRPMFRTEAYAKPGQIDLILKNQAKISKVIRRGHVDTQTRADRAIFQRLAQFLRAPKPQTVTTRQNVLVELQYTPTLDELKAMIEAEQADIEAVGWEDMGFVFRGEPTTHWIGRSGARGDFPLTIERTNEEVIVLSSLVESLNANQAQILNVLK